MPRLDLNADAVTLTEQLANIESVSRNEEAIADAVLDAARAHEQLITRETLATSYETGATGHGPHDVRNEVTVGDGEKATVHIVKR